jgi:hypothetical protein
MCSVCKANPNYLNQTLPAPNTNEKRSVTLYLCEDFAKKLFTRNLPLYKDMDDLDKPPRAFDDCGYIYQTEQADA